MPLKPGPADESRWVDISLEQNLTLVASRLAADIARDNVRVAVGGHLPTLDIVAGRSWQQDPTRPSIPSRASRTIPGVR